MAWCPKCKNEYVEGITVCADCDEALVDELVEEVQDFDSYRYNQEYETENMNFEDGEDYSLDEQAVGSNLSTKEASYYENKSDKAKEYHSSAMTLLIVGAIGFVTIIILHFTLFPRIFNPFSRYLFSCVMGLMFLIFIASGVHSFKAFKRLKEEGVKEDSLIEEIKKWCNDNISRERLEKEMEADLKEEVAYFKRTTIMKKLVHENFANLDENLVDQIIDEIYTKLYD